MLRLRRGAEHHQVVLTEDDAGGPMVAAAGPKRSTYAACTCLPALTGRPGRCAAVEVVGQAVEADVPARGIAGAFAEFVERVHERQQAAVAVRLQLEPQRLVIAPAELQHRRRLVPEHLAVDGRALAVAEREAQRRAGRPIARDLGGEPRRQVVGLGQRAARLSRGGGGVCA